LASKSFKLLKSSWDNGDFASLKIYRDKIIAHNDLSTIIQSNSELTTKIISEDISNIRLLFTSLWALLVEANFEINQSTILEPNFKSLNMLPNIILKELKQATYFAFILESKPEINENDNLSLSNFKYSNVGEEKIVRIID